MLGAKLLVVGTINDVSKENKKFKGYGISTSSIVATVRIRARVINIETGEVVYSKRGQGAARSNMDVREIPYYEAIEDAKF